MYDATMPYQAEMDGKIYDNLTASSQCKHKSVASNDYEEFRRQRARLRSPTPPWDDWPVPDTDDMTMNPQFMTYTRRKSRQETAQTPAEYEQERVAWIKRRERRREKEDFDMYQGLLAYKGSQRGWDGRQESERRLSEAEARSEIAIPTSLEHRNLAPYPPRTTAKELESAFESYQSQYTMDQIAATDHVSILQGRNYIDMTKAKWDPEAIREGILEDRRDENEVRARQELRSTAKSKRSNNKVVETERGRSNLRGATPAIKIRLSAAQSTSPSKKRNLAQRHSDEKEAAKLIAETSELSAREMRKLKRILGQDSIMNDKAKRDVPS